MCFRRVRVNNEAPFSDFDNDAAIESMMSVEVPDILREPLETNLRPVLEILSSEQIHNIQDNYEYMINLVNTIAVSVDVFITFKMD